MLAHVVSASIRLRWVCVTALVAMLAIGIWAAARLPIDAIPDIGEKQIIVIADWPGRSPPDVEDQVTYPLTVSLQGTPRVKDIRSFSGFGFSMIFVMLPSASVTTTPKRW